MRKTVIGAVVVVLGLTAAPAHADLAAVDDKSPSVVAADDVAGGVAVVRDGANLTRHTAGYSDIDARTGFAPNTHIRAASITKTFVAATVLQLVAEGRVNLDALIETYLPGCIRGDGNDANASTEYFDDVTPPPVEPATADQLLDGAGQTRPVRAGHRDAVHQHQLRPGASSCRWGSSRHTSPRWATPGCAHRSHTATR